jgi:hypothetical protein
MLIELLLAAAAQQNVEVYVSTHRGDPVPYARVTTYRNGQAQRPAPTTNHRGRVTFPIACTGEVKFRAYYVSGELSNNSSWGNCGPRVLLKFYP